MTPAGRQKVDRVWDVALKLVVPLSIVLVGAVLVNRISIKEIQATRFTNNDGNQLHQQLLTERPPQWLRDDVSEIKSILRDFDRRLRTVEVAVGAADARDD